ncbi:MAG: hypothetical protein DI640_14055 [Sphingomonas taxi]|uniref:Uncharacterized protein n=1 Tax=Sphingomonas taxi TaxID=1549858 RepID=A0A2W4YRP6_9SPHN|nr:MAG: hypothetical protein DI640_14055 [Sphingomonas taxi]
MIGCEQGRGLVVLITIFAPEKVHLLEVAGVLDALFEANDKIEVSQHYRVRIVTERASSRKAPRVLDMPLTQASGRRRILPTP